MTAAVRALRGATTIDEDTPAQIEKRVVELLKQMIDRNGVDHDDLISIWFTVTDDLCSAFPAAAARTIGLGDVPLLCAQEIPVPGSLPRVIRILMHYYAGEDHEPRHIYLGEAANLRLDLEGAQ